MRKLYVLFFIVFISAITANAQVSNYTFSQSNGTYTPITGGTVIITATDPNPSGSEEFGIEDFTYAEFPLPFPFYFGTAMQTSFRVNSNGWMGFGPATGSSTGATSTPISTTSTFNGIISPFGDDLMGISSTSGTVTTGSNTITAVSSTAYARIGAPIQGTGIPAGSTITGFTANTITISAPATSTATATFISWATGEIRTEVLGTAPNRTFVIQWSGMSEFNTSATGAGLNSQTNFQIRLSEAGGIPGLQTVTVVYGLVQHPQTTTGSVQVGLRGLTTADFNNRTSTTSWTATTAGSTSSSSVTVGPAIFPPSGLTFVWTPPPPCAVAAQPTGLVLTSTAGVVNGTFTAPATPPTNYLVIRTTSPTPPSPPVDGTTYIPGQSALGGTVVSTSTGTTFTSSTGIDPNTTYYFWVYSYNVGTSCTGGPTYNTVSPLSGNTTTPGCTVPAGTKTVGPTGNYPTLTLALNDVVTNGLAGPVIFELQPTYTSAPETFPIVIGPIGCATHGVTIRPQTGATGLVITSSDPTATIDFNGGRFVTIDGRPGGTGTTSQLSIINTATGNAVDLRFINDASNNVVTYTTLNGSTSTTNGVVLFSTGLVTGNDGNTLSNNNIGPAGANLPLNGIASFGTNSPHDNSGNTVISNNIADVFSAGSIFTGINLGAGNSTWTINNNRIFQTAPRAVTTANTNGGISVSSGNGYTISNNVIGFGSSTGTGTTDYTSTVALRYIGIAGNFLAGPPVNTISNNTIAGMTMTTSATTSTVNGIWAGINILGGDVNITGNTIGSSTGTGSVVVTPSSTGGLLVAINNASVGGTINIQNNTIGALTNSGTTATVSGVVTGILNSGASSALTISNNTIGNATADNIRAGTAGLSTTPNSQASGIFITTSPTQSVTITNNLIRNLSSTGTSTSSYVRGIHSSTSSNAVFTTTGNTIHNLTTNSGLTSATSGLVSAVGIHLGDGVNSLISENLIHTISNTTVATTNIYVAGITHAGGISTTISRNRIYNLMHGGTATSATTPAVAAGIVVRSGTTDITIVNNMISLGNGQTTNTAFLGIMLNNGSTPNPIQNVWFNTVHIEGTVTSGAQPTFGIARTDFSTTARTATVDIRNNLINNVRTGGTGQHFAIANNYGATTPSTTGWGPNASNYNVLNANSSTVGWWGGAQTFAGWKTASNSDMNSFSGLPVIFVNPATGDLHLNMGTTPTPIESSAQPISSVTTDYDNQVRPGPPGSVNGGALGPDIGADEFDGVYLDIVAPAISFIPFVNTLCPTGTRTLSATITDLSNINTAPGTRPRLYYKKTTNANVLPATNDNTTDGWKFVEATNTTSPFTFNLEYSRIFGGVAAGDVIQYFIVAQDLAATPNVGINSGTFTGTPTSVALASGNFPITGTIPSFNVNTGGLSGTVTIGAAGTYPTLTGPGGLFSVLNTQGLTGNLIADIIDPTVTETGATALNQLAQGCGGPFTLLIKPASGVTSTLTGSLNSGALIKILSSHVTIDGSNNGTTSRDLTITNTSTTSPSVVLIGSTGIVPVMNTIVKNSIIINGATSATAIVVSDANLGTAGYFNNITIQNNSVQRAFHGIYNIAVPQSGNGGGLLITGNDLTTSGTNAIRLNGIYVQGVDGATVSDNMIGNIANSADATNVGGIWLASNTMNSTVSGNTINGIATTNASGAPRGIVLSSGITNANVNIVNNTITGLTSSGTGATTGIYVFGATGNVDIQRNKISNIKHTSSGGFGANGIQLGSTLTNADIDVFNNFVSDVAGYGFDETDADDNGYGIIVIDGGGYDIDFNTVNMNTNQTLPAGNSAALNIQSTVVTPNSINIRNNILVNNQTIGNRFAVISEAPASVINIMDNNDYFSTGPNLALLQAAPVSDLAAMQAAFGDNMNSLVYNPIFVSPTDLHLTGDNWCLDGRGMPIPGITTDIDLQARHATTPDIGADEFTITNSSTATPSSQSVCSGTPITPIVLAGASSFNWTRNNTGSVTGIAASGTGNITGTLTNTTNAPVTVTFTITPINGGCSGPTFTATVIVNPTPDVVSSPASQTICSGASITSITHTSGVAGTTFNWTRDNTAQVTGIAASGTGDITGTLTNTTTAPVTVTFTITPVNAGCTGTPFTATVVVNPNATVVSSPSSQSICSGTSITPILHTGGFAGTTFNWTRDNTAQVTGIPASGSGDITGTLTNTTNAPVTVTFTITPTANSCPGTPVTATVIVNPQPVVSGTVTEPTTCAATDGAITLNLSGGSSYTFAWTGPGVNPTSQNQTGLGIGSYNVVVTANGGCTASASFTLNGPGGCTGCPTIGSVAATPSPVCANQSTTLTASGLAGMAATYGIEFKFSTTSLADPYSGGTTIATVPNSGLTGGGTSASTTTSFATAGTYFIYAILSPVPADPGCRPSAVTTLVVNPIPNAVANPSSQMICSGNAITPINLTGAVSGTTFTWTRDNVAQATGIPASGTGNISGTLTLTGGSGTLVTFTITPTANGCSGTPITATVTVNAPLMVTGTVVQPTTCVSSDGSITLNISNAGTGLLVNWTGPGINPASINQTNLGVGTYTVTVGTNTGCPDVTQTFNLTGPGGCAVCPTIGSVTANPSPVCPNQTTTLTASGIVSMGSTHGIEFKYSTTSLADPYTGGTNIATVPNSGLTGGGTTAATTTSFATPGTYFIYAILSPVPADPSCRPSAVTSLTVNPTPDAVATPASQTSCSGTAITPINLTGAVSGTTFTWTRDNTAQVTGIAASGTGNISGTLTNTTTSPVTVTFTITPTANGCTGPTTTATVVVNPLPTVDPVTNQTVCHNGSTTAITFTGSAGATFNWTNDNTSIGLPASGTGNIASFVATNTGTSPVTATITVTPTSTSGATCTGTPTTFTITVNPAPTVNAVTSQTVCHNGSTAAITFTGSAGATFNWTNDNTSIGLPASGTGNIASFVATNTGTAPVTATITVTPTATSGGVTCTGTPVTFTITVNPTPTVNAVTNQTVCHNSSTTAITFSGTAGASFAWTNNNTSIGLAASGTGNIPSFVATNTGTAPVTATITVTPTTTTGGVTCTGTPTTFTITVNPTPTVNAVSNQTVCHNASTAAIAFSGTAGATFTWTNNTTSIGLAASGTGNIASFVATNTGTAPVTATITVTPTLTSGSSTCTGTPITFTITVNPTPTVNAITNQTVCPGAATAAVTLAGTVTGTVFNWTNNNTSIGLGASGTGNIPSFTAVNTGVNPVTATITVTPSFTNNGVTCTGTPRTFTITVNTVPTITCPANITVNTAAGQCSAVVTYPNATATGSPAPTITYSIASGSTFPVGTTTVTATATNSCGTATCTFMVRVNDTQAPVITCPANITAPSATGLCTAVVNYSVTATDNCTGVTVTRTAGPASGSAFPIGTTTVTHVATDAAGNSSTCSFTVTVTDGNLPVISSQPANRTACVGTNATFSVTSSNVVSFQWQQWNGTAWVNIPNATTSSFTVNNVTQVMNTNTFRVVITGACSSVNSNPATLFVPSPATVVLSANPLTSLLPNQTTTLVATPSSSGGSFAWFFNNTLIPGATGPTFGPVSVNNLGAYRVVFTDANGCVSSAATIDITAANSNMIWVYPNPNFGDFQVRFSNLPNENTTVNVYNSLGQRVYSRALTTGGTPFSQIDISLGVVTNGVYVVEVVNSSGKQLAARKIVVQKF